MLRFLVRLAVRLARLAGEALFCFEVNRFLGSAVRGPIRYRLRALAKAETDLLAGVRAPLVRCSVTLPCGLRLHTLIAGPCAAALSTPRALRRRWRGRHSGRSGRHRGGGGGGGGGGAACATVCLCDTGLFTQKCAGGTCDAFDPGHNPVVLLHGHSMAAAHFFANVDDLLSQGYTSVLAPDLPGWGRSSRPRFEGRTASDAVAFYVTPLRAWLNTLHLERFTLLGHSLGGYVAHELALAEPARVSRLILAAPAAISRHTKLATALWFAVTPQRFLTHGGLFAHVLFALQYPSARAYNVAGFREFTLFANSVAHRSGDAAAARMLRFVRDGHATDNQASACGSASVSHTGAAAADKCDGQGNGGAVTTRRRLIRWRGECARPLLDRVRKLSCGVQLVIGDRDDLVNLSDVLALRDRLHAAGNSVQLSVIGGADHSPHICAPDAFAKAILGGEPSIPGDTPSSAAVTAADVVGRHVGSVVRA